MSASGHSLQGRPCGSWVATADLGSTSGKIPSALVHSSYGLRSIWDANHGPIPEPSVREGIILLLILAVRSTLHFCRFDPRLYRANVASMSATPQEQHAVVALFIAELAIRPDRERVLLAREFCEHAATVWPDGVPAGVTPGWMVANLDGMLATAERLFAHACNPAQPSAGEFLRRMAWLPPLLVNLDRLSQ